MNKTDSSIKHGADVNQFVKTETALGQLHKLPLLSIGAASTLLWIHFGQETTVTSSSGGTKTVGSWAIHIQCPWRIVNQHGIFTGSGDLWEPPVLGDDGRDELFDANKDTRRFDVQIKRFLSDAQGALVKKIAVDVSGGFRLFLERSYVIEVFPICSQEIECWRLFQPASSENHFVVTGVGIQCADTP
jgi:hypothetical protein